RMSEAKCRSHERSDRDFAALHPSYLLMPSLLDGRKLKAELPEYAWIVGPLRRVENLDTDNAAFGIVIDDDAVGDLFAVLDGTVGQVDIDRVRPMIDSHAHGLVLSK